MSDPSAPTPPSIGPWLDAARVRSDTLLQSLAARTAAEAEHFHCVLAAGSLGRREAAAGADLDTLFIVDERAGALADSPAQSAIERFFSALAGLGLHEPKPHGIFRTPVSRQTLLAPAARGRLDESPAHFGPRIQCLLDARAIHGVGAFTTLQREILEWYEPRPRLSIEPLWAYLESDLVRYAHAYRNWQRMKTGDDAADSWALRQAKLHTTRHVTWLGLQALILRARALGGGAAEMLPWLRLSPIERLVQVAAEDDASLAREIGGRYEAMLAFLGAPGVRAGLIAIVQPIASEDSLWEAPEPLAGLLDRVRDFRTTLDAWVRLRAARGLPAGMLT